MTIEFEKSALCAHPLLRAGDPPVFGCRGCIDKDREGAIREFFFSAKRPTCPRNHGEMMIASGDRVAMTVTYECAADEDCDEIAVVAVTA